MEAHIHLYLRITVFCNYLLSNFKELSKEEGKAIFLFQ